MRDRRSLLQQHPVDPGWKCQRYFKKGQYVVVGKGEQPGGSQDGKGGDGSVSGVNKLLNTVLTAAGVTKTGGAPTDDFGDASLPKGIFTEMLA